MPLIISEATIIKINHKIQEIRKRSLTEVEDKLKRHLQYRDELVFNALSLYNALIDALTTDELKLALKAILLLLKTQKGCDVVKLLGSNRIRKDINNSCQTYLENPTISSKVNEIFILLPTLEAIKKDETILEDFNSLNINGNQVTDQSCHENSDYVQYWSMPHLSDLHEMKRLKETLARREDSLNMENALNFMQGAIRSFPAEYFLQPPYLYKNLFDCVRDKDFDREALQLLGELIGSLTGRIKIRSLPAATNFEEDCKDIRMHNQISITAFCRDLFALVLDRLTQIDIHNNQEELYQYFKLIFKLVQLIQISPRDHDNCFILEKLTLFAKFLRELSDSNPLRFEFRVNYIIMLQILTAIASITSTEEYEKLVPVVPWLEELQNNLLDYSLRYVYPEIYDEIFKICGVKGTDKELSVLINCEEVLLPAVKILRRPDRYTNEELVRNGMNALETLKIHKSVGLVKRLVNAVIKCASDFEGNPEIRECGEKLLLRLLALNVPHLKNITYKMCVESVKTFFSGITDGLAFLPKNGAFKVHYAGIPLNAEILTEIICFGLNCNEDAEVIQASQIILMFLVRGKPILGHHWKHFLEILLPVMPLLQSTVDVTTKLGRAIFELYDPDSTLSTLESMHGNLRYLFSKNINVREEALYRLIFLVSKHPQNEFYLPNIEHIKDTLTQSICLIQHPLPLRSTNQFAVYNSQTLRDLLDLMKSKDVTPSVRHSTLLQINVMVEDPNLCDLVYYQNDWPYILKSFDTSLKADHTRDYPDSAVPALKILCKLCIRVAELRRNIAKDTDFIFLVIRALFLNHHDPDFKMACATLIFIVTFSDFVVGSDDLSFPKVLNGLLVPFQCNFHFSSSPFDKISSLEAVFYDAPIDTEVAYNDLVIVIDDDDPNSIGDNLHSRNNNFTECGSAQLRAQNHRRLADINSNLKDKHDKSLKDKWRFIRMVFAALWFEGIDDVFQNLEKNCQGPFKSETGWLGLNYSDIPALQQNESVTSPEDILDFDSNLHLTAADVNWMRITSVTEYVKNAVSIIDASKSHAAALDGVVRINTLLLLPQHMECFPNKIVKAIRKFVMTPPGSAKDEQVLVRIIDLLHNLIITGYDNVLVWMLTQLNDGSCVFFYLLQDKNYNSLELYKKNVQLLRTIVKISCQVDNDDVLKLLYNISDSAVRRDNESNVILHLFDIISDELSDCDKHRVQTLLSLLLCLTTNADIDSDELQICKVVKHLFTYIQVLKPLAQSGSNVVKNCLLIIGQLMKLLREPLINPKHTRLLSGLCSHLDPIIRASSWDILSIVAERNLKGAASIVTELAFLPGGIHACVLSTALDEEEVSVVKGAAARLFTALLSHKSDKGLHDSVLPLCNDIKASSIDRAVIILGQIARKQGLLTKTLNALSCFSPNMFNNSKEKNQLVTPPGTVIYLCSIYISIFDLRNHFAFDDTDIKYLDAFVRCVASTSRHIAPATLMMVSEVCKLLSRYLCHDDTILSVVIHNPGFLNILLTLLDNRFYESEELCEETVANIFQTLKLIGSIPNGYEIMCYVLDEIDFSHIVEFVNMALMHYERPAYIITVLDCLTALLMNSDLDVKNVTPFNVLLDEVKVRDFLDHQAVTETVPNDEKYGPDYGKKCGGEILMMRVIQLFDIVTGKDKPKNGLFMTTKLKSSVYNALQAFLRYSDKARQVAEEEHLFGLLQERLELIFVSVGMSCTEYIRKFGDRKKEPVIDELGSIVNIIQAWYECSTLLDQNSIQQFNKNLIVLWPWTEVDSNLKLKFIDALISISEDSLPVCLTFSSPPFGQQSSILKLVVDTANHETSKTKTVKVNADLLSSALRVMINCSACVEGRVMLSKLNVLNVINKFHPAVTKMHPASNRISELWLQFWEVFSRYAEGNQVRHLPVLCAIIRKTTCQLRLMSLKILRNMAFSPSNRAALLSNDEFIFVVNMILENGKHDERLLIATTIWKIVANNCRAKNTVKASSIVRRINSCSRELAIYGKTEDELFNILTTINNILDS